MENRIISMFGFIVKKEYVLYKIKEFLHHNEDLDFINLPETFKEVLENHLNTILNTIYLIMKLLIIIYQI
jgi:hypothetical protein